MTERRKRETEIKTKRTRTTLDSARTTCEVFTEHISDHVSSLLGSRLGSAHAHHIEPFNDLQPQPQQQQLAATPSIFDRLPADNKMAQAHQAKRQKKITFIDNLAEANK